jgi:hypothetical protein
MQGILVHTNSSVKEGHFEDLRSLIRYQHTWMSNQKIYKYD